MTFVPYPCTRGGSWSCCTFHVRVAKHPIACHSIIFCVRLTAQRARDSVCYACWSYQKHLYPSRVFLLSAFTCRVRTSTSLFLYIQEQSYGTALYRTVCTMMRVPITSLIDLSSGPHLRDIQTAGLRVGRMCGDRRSLSFAGPDRLCFLLGSNQCTRHELGPWPLRA